MKKLDVSITRAQLVGFQIQMNEEGGMECSATIVLMTELGKTVTSHTISTNAWREEDKFDMPFDAIPAIQKIAGALETAVVEKYRDRFLALPSPQNV